MWLKLDQSSIQSVKHRVGAGAAKASEEVVTFPGVRHTSPGSDVMNPLLFCLMFC